MSESPSSSRAGRQPDAPFIPDYQLLRLVGRGAYGEVWLARGLTGTLRAIKIVWRDQFDDPEPFEREFRGLIEFSAVTLKEPGQLALLHVGRNESAGFFYYVMELADDASGVGGADPARYVPLTFKELLARRGRIPAPECLTFAVAAARALAALHARNLVHRDIKPANIILVAGTPKLADIGLLAATAQAHTFVGTNGYVPPEGPGSPAADVFALGKVLYQLATGFDGEDFPRLPDDLDTLPDRAALLELNEVLLRACEPAVEKRHHNASALLAGLEQLQQGHSLRSRRRGQQLLPAGLAALALVALFGGVWWWRGRVFATPAVTAVPPPLSASSKSIVVLPLENLSPDPANAYFTDGMHEEIIATLSRLPGLRVISRATAERFKHAALPDIGETLNVADVLTGSVRRDGRAVRVQLELRRAKDEAVLWQNTFDREFTTGFALQDEIAAEVAKVLQLEASSGWYAGAKFMTRNPEAYDLFLKARDLPGTKGGSVATFREQIQLCEQAIALDPNFMSAVDLLSSACAYCRLVSVDPVERADLAAKAKRAAERASQLVPGGAGDGALAVYYALVERDPERQLLYARNEIRATPNDPNGYNRLGVALEAYGREREAWQAYNQALALDPFNIRVLQNRVGCAAWLRDVAAFEQAVATNLQNGGPNTNNGRGAILRFLMTGKLPATGARLPGNGLMLGYLHWYGRRFEALLALDNTGPQWNFELKALQARAAYVRERRDAFARMVGELTAFTDHQALAATPTDTWPRRRRMWALALASRSEEALAIGRRLVEEASGEANTAERRDREQDLALVYAWCGRKKECVELIGHLLTVPSGVTVPYLRLSPDWDNVRDDPKFEALLQDPKNSAPL